MPFQVIDSNDIGPHTRYFVVNPIGLIKETLGLLSNISLVDKVNKSLFSYRHLTSWSCIDLCKSTSILATFVRPLLKITLMKFPLSLNRQPFSSSSNTVIHCHLLPIRWVSSKTKHPSLVFLWRQVLLH